MKKYLNQIGILILIAFFLIFFVITTICLEKRNLSKTVEPKNITVTEETTNYDNEKDIVNNLYQNVRMLYDVVNNKFRVSQDETITIGEVVYKKIINFNEITSPLFTKNGLNKYIEDLGNYFAYDGENYYLAGNLVSYQTYYFRGDNTNIYITNVKENEIDGIIYEKWTSNNKNTLATIKVVKESDTWLIDKIDILATE